MYHFFQLVDLKAELYRKQEAFKQDKLAQDAGTASKSHNHTKVNKQRFKKKENRPDVLPV